MSALVALCAWVIVQVNVLTVSLVCAGIVRSPFCAPVRADLLDRTSNPFCRTCSIFPVRSSNPPRFLICDFYDSQSSPGGHLPILDFRSPSPSRPCAFYFGIVPTGDRCFEPLVSRGAAPHSALRRSACGRGRTSPAAPSTPVFPPPPVFSLPPGHLASFSWVVPLHLIQRNYYFASPHFPLESLVSH